MQLSSAWWPCRSLLMTLQLYRLTHTLHTQCCTIACGENLHADHTVSHCFHSCLIHQLGSHADLAHTLSWLTHYLGSHTRTRNLGCDGSTVVKDQHFQIPFFGASFDWRGVCNLHCFCDVVLEVLHIPSSSKTREC